ncbi:MAG: alpha/beta hydrolase [Bacteroidales bacterium]|nr:alpha/beta hydrolase [Bacteroidales bacterium]
MKFKQLEVQNLKIAVYESEGTGYPVVFFHSNSVGAAEYYWQMMSEEGEKYRFISIDLPGHGASDFSFQPETFYNLNTLSDIMAAIIQYLDFDNCIVCGHELGAHIALRTALKANKVKGLMLVGFSPLESYQHIEKSYYIDEVYKLFSKGKLNEAEVSVLAQLFISSDDVANIMHVDNIKNTDPNFRIHVSESYKTDLTNDFTLLNQINVPITILNGDKDRIVKLDYLKSLPLTKKLWREKVQIISDSGNSPMWEKYKVFNYFIEQFVNDITK